MDTADFPDGTNLFSYVTNNPVRYFDPVGREATDHGFLSGLYGRLADRVTAPTEGQKAFKAGHYGEFAVSVVVDAVVATNPALALTIGDVHLARAIAQLPGQVADAVTNPRGDQAGSKMADVLVTGVSLALRVAGPKVKGVLRNPTPAAPVAVADAPVGARALRTPSVAAPAAAEPAAPKPPTPATPVPGESPAFPKPAPKGSPPTTATVPEVVPSLDGGNGTSGSGSSAPTYLIREGVRRAVASRELGNPTIAARKLNPATGKFSDPVQVPLDQLTVEPSKAAVPRDSRYIDVFQATGRGEIRTPIDILPVDPVKNPGIVPLGDVKLTRGR